MDEGIELEIYCFDERPIIIIELESPPVEWLDAISFMVNEQPDTPLRFYVLPAGLPAGWIRRVPDHLHTPEIERWTSDLARAYRDRFAPSDTPQLSGNLLENLVDRTDPPVDTILKSAKQTRMEIESELASPVDRFNHTMGLESRLTSPDNPNSTHHEYARRTIDEADAPDECRDLLARKFLKALKRLETRREQKLKNTETDLLVDKIEPSFWGEGDHDRTDLHAEAHGSVFSLDGMLWLDKVGIEWMDDITNGAIWGSNYVQSDTSDEVAQTRRKIWSKFEQGRLGGDELLSLWLDPDSSIPTILQPARCVINYLWHEKIRPKWRQSRNNRPALNTPIHTDLERVAMREGRSVQRDDDDPQMRLFEGDEEIAKTPVLENTKLAEIVEEGTDDLQSITGMRLLVYLVRRCHRQHFEGQQQPRVIEVEGGVQALAERIGETSATGQDRLKRILRAGQHWHIEWSGGEAGGLWTYTYDDTSGSNKRAYLELTLGAPLAPEYGLEHLDGSDRILVPVVELAPFVAPGNYYAHQAAFQQALVRAIVERREHIAEHGGARLTERELWQLAEPLGLPQSTMERAIDRWLRDGDDGPQFLEMVQDDGVYHLADNERYGLARRFIDETARRFQQASEAGKRSAQKRKNRE